MKAALLKKTFALIFLITGFILIFFFLVTSGDTVNNLDYNNRLLTREQKDLIYNHMKQYPDKTRMALAFITGDSCVFYGIIKDNDTVRVIENKNSLFEIGSITKVFTTTLLASYVLDSALTTDRNINEDLDFELNDNIKISYKELANHTSGLPRRPPGFVFTGTASMRNPYKYFTTEKLEKYLAEKMKVDSSGGAKYEYSNLGMGILGYVLCSKAKKNYETLLQERIFSKYGLTHTTTVNGNINGNLVAGCDPFGRKTLNWDLASLEAACSIVSSVSDLSRFVIAQFDTANAELSLTRETTFVIDSTLEVGLGWHILKDKSENKWYWHNGGTGGYRSSLVFDSENKKGVIILTNISTIHPKSKYIDGLCFELMKRM